jgi:alkylation response protein AidB-like acyl-CoA dehydrogenase
VKERKPAATRLIFLISELRPSTGAGVLTEDDLAVEGGRWQDAFLYARAWTIAGGSNEIMRNLIAERHLGLPREARP